MGLDIKTISEPKEKSKQALFKENKQLRGQVQQLKHQVLELTLELEKLVDENNALKDRLNNEVKSYQLAEAAKQRQRRQQKRAAQQEHKNRGAPKGHKGANRSKPEHVAETCLYPLDSCPNCFAGKEHIKIYNETVVYEERIIPQKTYVKKKIKQHGYCKICHEKISSYVPDGMYHFHPETQAIIAAKQLEERLTFKLIETSFAHFSDFHITAQGALNVFERVGTVLLPVYNQLSKNIASQIN
jgi:regulator of replication initiation timing